MLGTATSEISQGLDKAGLIFSKAWKKHRLAFPILGKLVAVLLLGSLAHGAEVKLPTGVYPLNQFGTAKEEAVKGGKALAFVLSELKGKGSKAAIPNTNYAFDKLKGVCVPIYVDYADDLKALPERHPLVNKALQSGQAGKTIPRVAVTDTDIKRVLAVVSTMPVGVMGDGVYEDACKQIQAYLKDPEKQVRVEAGQKEKKKRNR